MEITQLVDYLTIPKVNRGVITRPRNSSLGSLKPFSMKIQTWEEYTRQKDRTDIPLTFGQVAALFVSEVNKLKFNILQTVPDREKLSKAIMIGLSLQKGLDVAEMDRFRNVLAQGVVNNDFIPIYVDDDETKRRMQIAHQTIKHIFQLSHKVHTEFDRLAYHGRSDGITEIPKPPFLEQFIQHITPGRRYRWYQGPSNEFPGKGIIIENGIGTPLFPRKALKKQLYSKETYTNTPHQVVKKRQRNLMVTHESDLYDFNFSIGLFRFLTVIRQPKIMFVDKNPYALIVFNDHYGTPLMTFLIPDKDAVEFLKDPAKAMEKGTPCDPKRINDDFIKKILNLCWISNIGGMNRAVPAAPPKGMYFPNCIFLDSKDDWYHADLFEHETWRTHKNETRDWNDKMHLTHSLKDKAAYVSSEFPIVNLEPHEKAHNEISLCAQIGFALYFDLIRGLNLYSYGYNFDPGNQKIVLSEPLRLLDQSIRWSLSPKEKNKPFLIPMTEEGFDKALVEEVGAVDTNLMVCYRRNRGTFMLPRDLSENIVSNSREDWLNKFLVPAFHQVRNNRPAASLEFVPGDQMGPIIKETLGVR